MACSSTEESSDLVAEANSTRSPNLKKNSLISKKQIDSEKRNPNLERKLSRDQTSLKRKAKKEKANPNETETNERENPKAQFKEKLDYVCKFCKRQGHKVSTCRYKQRKEKQRKEKQEAQKEKSEANFKHFIRNEIQALIKEVKEALKPTLMLNKILERFETHEDKINRLKEFHEQLLQQYETNQRVEQQKEKEVQPCDHANKEGMKPTQNHEETWTRDEDEEYTWEKEMKQTQHHEIEDAWKEENAWEKETSPTGFEEKPQSSQNQEENCPKRKTQQEQIKAQDKDREQPEEEDDEYYWEKQMKQSNQHYEEEKAWEAEDQPTGFGNEPAAPLTQGDSNKTHLIQKKFTHNFISSNPKNDYKHLRSTHNQTEREVDPTFWYIYKPEKYEKELLIRRKAWIITSKKKDEFTARKLWINGQKEYPIEDDFTTDHAKDFRPLSPNEKEQAHTELKFLNEDLKKQLKRAQIKSRNK